VFATVGQKSHIGNLPHRQIDWRNPLRAELYPIPPQHSAAWHHVRTAAADAAALVLPSDRVHGFAIPTPLPINGHYRVAEWTYLPDLLFLNPYEFFLTHPSVSSLWIQTDDPHETVELVSHPSEADEIPSLLVLDRSEVTYAFCDYIRQAQRDFFARHQLTIPAAQEFSATVCGQ
jgi:hypothetical protein